jgi:hypothetical protein
VDGSLRVPGRFQSGIGDEQHPSATQVAGELAEPGQAAGPEDHAIECHEVKWGNFDGPAGTCAGGGDG